MTFTQAQLEQIISISSTANIISGAAVITDNTPYSSIGITTGDTVKVLLQIIDPSTDVFYENAGYQTADFSSPDLLPLTTPISYSFTMPTYTTGDYISGEYTVNMKIQVVQGSETAEVFSAQYMNVCGCCNDIVANVQGNVSYNTAIVSVTDNTQYGAWTSLTNVIKLYPPTNTGSVQTLTAHGSPATLVWEPPVGTFPYTGTWQWTLASEISYTDSISGTTTTCELTAQGSFQVLQSQLCVVRCLLDKYRTEMYAKIRVKANPLLERNYLLAEADFLMALASERCALPQTTIDKYIANIYLLTGIDPDCDCGCSEGTSQPLVPTSSINGTDGTDGTIIYSGTTVPSNGTGVVGDYYIRTTNGFLYKKTGASTWTYQLTLIGAAGSDGQNAGGLIYSDPDNHATTTNGSYETLSTFSTDHTDEMKNLVNIGDTIKLYAAFAYTNNPTATGISVRLLINGTGLANIPLNLWNSVGAEEGQVIMEANVVLQDNTSGNMMLRIDLKTTIYKYIGVISGVTVTEFTKQFCILLVDIGGVSVDFSANDYAFSAQANSVATGDVYLQLFQGEKLTVI